MKKASEMRALTKTNEDWVEMLVRNTCEEMERAAEAGQFHVKAWCYDRCRHRWLGDVPDAVIEEVERRFADAGYELEWQIGGGYERRIIKW